MEKESKFFVKCIRAKSVSDLVLRNVRCKMMEKFVA